MFVTGGLPILPAVLLLLPLSRRLKIINVGEYSIITRRTSPAALAVAFSRPAGVVAGGCGGGES